MDSQLSSNAAFEIFTSFAYSTLAFYYHKLAVEMPDVVAGIDIEEKDTNRRRNVYFWIRVANIVFPVLEAISAAIFILDYHYNKGQGYIPKFNWYYTSMAAMACVGLTQIFTGIVLIWSLSSIGKYLMEGNQTEQLNLKTMRIHKLVFIPHLVLVVGYYGTQYVYIYIAISNADLENKLVLLFETVTLYTQIVYIFLSFAVQCLLCVIFI